MSSSEELNVSGIPDFEEAFSDAVASDDLDTSRDSDSDSDPDEYRVGGLAPEIAPISV